VRRCATADGGGEAIQEGSERDSGIGKTFLVAQQRFRRLDGPEWLREVAEGVVYVDGVREKRGNAKAAA